MVLSEELDRLDDLRRRGVLSDEEFARAKALLLSCNEAPPLAALGALRRSRTERWIAGVCGGIARATGTDAWVWRLIFVLLSFFGGAGLGIYLLMWIFVPAE